MAIEVLLFGPLAELAGERQVRIAPPLPATVGAVWTRVVALHPTLATRDAGVRPAINETYSGWNAVLQDGDTLAFIPPVAGG